MEILETDKNSGLKKLFIEYMAKFMVIPIFVSIINIVLFNIARVSGESMTPTLHEHDMVFVNKITSHIHSPSKGDIAIIKFRDEGEYIVKRIIGIEGDLVEIINQEVYVNGNVLNEEYLKEAYTLDFYGGSPWIVPKDKIFVLGDCRDSDSSITSLDSRSFGPLPVESIEGIVQFKFFPKIKSLIYK